MCKWRTLTLKTGNEGEDIRGEMGQPKRNIAGRKFSAERVGNGSCQFTDGHRSCSGDGVAASNCLRVLCTELKCPGQVVNVNRMQKCPPAVNDAKESFVNRCE